MNDFINTARSELAALSSELDMINHRKRVLEKKIDALRAYITAEDSPRKLMFGASLAQSMPEAPPKRSLFFRKSVGTVTQTIVDTAMDMLQAMPSVKTDELLERINSEDKIVGTTAASISSILSRDDRFVANRKDGWSLAKKEGLTDGEAPDFPPTPT